MSKIPYTPQQREIIKALMAAGCGIVRPKKLEVVRRSPEDEAERKRELLASLPASRAHVSVLTLQDLPPDLGPGLQTLLTAVSIVYGVGLPALRSSRRDAPTVRARHAYFFIAKQLTARSLQQIGRAAGNKDHSTVLHGINKVAAAREAFEPELSRIITQFQKVEGQ